MPSLRSCIPSFLVEAVESLRRMNVLQLFLQALNFATVVLTAYMMWKGLGVLTNNESPIVVVLSESMSPAFERGDILFLTMFNSEPIAAGDIVVFNIKGRDIPIVHRVLKVHEERKGGELKVLTKGDNNDVHDRGLYKRGQRWLSEGDLVGRVKGYTPFMGMVTIIMNDYPQVKTAVLALLAVLVITNREAIPMVGGGDLGLAFRKGWNGHRNKARSQLHSVGFADGASWVNKASVFEQSDVDNLVDLASLAGREFTAERANATFVNSVPPNSTPPSASGVLEAPLLDWLRVPRRPGWSRETPVEVLRRREQESFLEWRRTLAKAEESDNFILTPFERNLEIWRQLWRVLEACDTIVHVVDARNPLLFYCDDVSRYAKELDPNKKILVLCNKGDFLTRKQRKYWHEYFASIGIEHVFYSAQREAENAHELNDPLSESQCTYAPWDLVGSSWLKNLLAVTSNTKKVGLVGFPNVGKSSTINSLIGTKKVGVAATPGKTKHVQTIVLEGGIILHDCPGLIFPNVSTSKSELVINGILPIDNLRECIQPVSLIISMLPIDILLRAYGVEWEPREEFEGELEPTQNVSALEFLSKVAKNRGFVTSFHGNPDHSRASRIILKDFVSGRLLYCYPPPTMADGKAFNDENFLAAREALASKRVVRAVHTGDLLKRDPHISNADKNGFVLTKVVGNHRLPSNSKKHFKKDKRKK